MKNQSIEDENYMNDSLRTSVFVRHPPETIACACIYLAARVLQIPLPTQPAWYDLFNADETDLHDICISILKVYQAKPTTYEKTEDKVQAVRDAIRHEKQKSRGLEIDKLNSANNSPMSAASAGSPYQRDNKNLAKKAVMMNKSRHDSKDKMGHNDVGKRSRTRSSSRHVNPQSPSSSDSNNERSHKKRRHNDQLPKSYSQHNDDTRERRRRRHKHRKTHRSGSHHRTRKSRHGSREKNYPTETSHKKHKRKSAKATNGSAKQNGEKIPSSPKQRRKHSSRYRSESYKKQRTKHSPISPPSKV